MNSEPVSAIDAANSEIRRARRERQRQLSNRIRWDLSMLVLDEMLEDLEQLNLRGIRRVPTTFEPRITALAEVLVPEAGDLPPMRTNIAPTRLMDMVFDLQERVLDLRSGGRRVILDDELGEAAGAA